MPEILIIALVWLVGTCFRIYQQARFYQIEEYMSGRYLRWCYAKRERWLPNRPIIAWLAGVVIGVILSEAPGNFVLIVAGIIAAIIGVWPPSEGEVKKGFKATPRAKRLLGVSFGLAIVITAILLVIFNRLPLPDIGEVKFAGVSFIGLIVFLCAPLFLV